VAAAHVLGVGAGAVVAAPVRRQALLLVEAAMRISDAAAVLLAVEAEQSCHCIHSP
jgi:hypothetical protein